MTDYQKINQLFTGIKTCPDIANAIYFDGISNLFPLLTKTEQNESAQCFYLWAEEHAVKEPLKFCYARFLLAHNYFLTEQHDSALHIAIETQKLFEDQNESGGTACCLALLGGIYRTVGNFDLALRTLWEGYHQLKANGTFSHFLSACSYNLGSIYFELGNIEEAIHLFKNTLEQSEQVGDQFWRNYALHGLGKVYLWQKKYPEAKEFFEQALIHAEQDQKPLAICNSLTELANYHVKAGDFSEAELLHKQALLLREQHHFIGGAITNYIHLAEILLHHSKPDEALLLLEKGLQLAEQIKIKPKMYFIHSLLSDLYQSKNDLKKSLFHYKQFHKIREQVELEDSTKKIKNAKLIFEVEQTQKENCIIKKQKAEIEKQNIELQETIDELTRAKIGKKAKAFTLMIAVVFFILEDKMLYFVLTTISTNNYYFSLLVKMVIIFSLNPINKAIETFLLKRLIKNKNRVKEIYLPPPGSTISTVPVFYPMLAR